MLEVKLSKSEIKINPDLLKDMVITPLSNQVFIIKGIYKERFFKASAVKDKNKYQINLNGNSYLFELVNEISDKKEEINLNESGIFAPMNGVIKEVLVNENEEISEGQILLRIESMKLVLGVSAPFGGIVKSLSIKNGQKVSANEFLLEIIK